MRTFRPAAQRLEVHKRDASPTHRQVVTLRRHRVPLHLLAPPRVQQPGHHDHRACRADRLEDLAVHHTDRIRVTDMTTYFRVGIHVSVQP